MATSQLNAYKRERRNQARIITRQALFIDEYVQTKYPDIYIEAANKYNEINQYNSTKPDLRKTLEFRLWKNGFAAVNNRSQAPVRRKRPYNYKKQTYRNIVVSTTTTNPQHNTYSPKKQINMQVNERTMCLNIRLLPPPVQRKPLQPPEVISNIQETVIEEGDQAEDSDPTTRDIQSISPPPVQPPEVISNIQETVMEEGDRAEDLNPTIFDEISAETMETILTELRADPHLKTMMDNMEKNTEQEETAEQEETIEELIGLTVDVPELYDPLEEEMLCW